MKANELMIGDWVRVPVSTNGAIKVGEISGDTISNDADTWLLHESEIEPIPLTPEILEKNGWVNVSDEDCKVMQIYRGHDAFWWSSVSGCCGCEGVENKNGEENLVERFACENIWNVHELQHALRLCGIEKEIEL